MPILTLCTEDAITKYQICQTSTKFQLGFFSEHQMAAEWRMTLKFTVISVIVCMQSLTCEHADQHALHSLLAEIKACSVSWTESS